MRLPLKTSYVGRGRTDIYDATGRNLDEFSVDDLKRIVAAVNAFANMHEALSEAKDELESPKSAGCRALTLVKVREALALANCYEVHQASSAKV